MGLLLAMGEESMKTKPKKKKLFAPDSTGNIHLGAFYLGWQQVDLFATVPPHENGGSFYHSPEHGKLPRIKVGIDYSEWNHVVSILLHETMEFAMEKLHVRYKKSGNLSGSHASYLFVLDHEQFCECAEMTGNFIADCLPKLATAYRANRKKGKK